MRPPGFCYGNLNNISLSRLQETHKNGFLVGKYNIKKTGAGDAWRLSVENIMVFYGRQGVCGYY